MTPKDFNQVSFKTNYIDMRGVSKYRNSLKDEPFPFITSNMCACRIREHKHTQFHQGTPYYQINLTLANIRIPGGDIARAFSHWLANSLVSCKRIALLFWISSFRPLKAS